MLGRTIRRRWATSLRLPGVLLNLLVIFVGGATREAYAVFIVDTGPGPTDSFVGNPAFSHTQWLAAEFTIGDPFTVTDVEGWIVTINAGTATVALYSDGGEIPGSELYSAQFSIPGTSPGQLFTTDWFGATGLAWGLAAGTYWVAFESRPDAGDTFAGLMAQPSSSPLDNEAFRYLPDSSVYVGWDSLDIGVRIQAVPEPSTLFLLICTGLAGLAVLKRSVKN